MFESFADEVGEGLDFGARVAELCRIYASEVSAEDMTLALRSVADNLQNTGAEEEEGEEVVEEPAEVEEPVEEPEAPVEPEEEEVV